MHDVAKYIMWAVAENKNEPFVGFSLLLCHTTEKKGELGKLWGLDFREWKSVLNVSGGAKGAVLLGNLGNLVSLRYMSKICGWGSMVIGLNVT